MITKSKTRKDKNFRQLVEYIYKDNASNEHSFTYVHNMDRVQSNDREAIIQQFEVNDSYRKNRKNGVVQYHEYLSFSPKDSKAIKEQPFILQDMARKYIELRAPNSLAIARPHFDCEHIHLHFLFSGNEQKSNKPTRISKHEFQQVKEQICQYQQELYPQLIHSYNGKEQGTKVRGVGEQATDKQRAMQKRGVKASVKTELRECITPFLNSHSQADTFFNALYKSGIEVYKYRGVEVGVLHKEKKHRLVTLFKQEPDELEKVKVFINERRATYQKEREIAKREEFLTKRRLQRTEQSKDKELEKELD